MLLLDRLHGCCFRRSGEMGGAGRINKIRKGEREKREEEETRTKID